MQLTGACGQIGVELVLALRKLVPADAILSTDVRAPAADSPLASGPFRYLDVTEAGEIERAAVEHRATSIIHLATVLSALGEKNPQVALKINTRSVENVLETASRHQCQVFIPSTIGAFGPTTPRTNTPDVTIQRPTTIYGLCKVYAEHLGEWYNLKRGVDFRSLRFPGIISSRVAPGGGTTDWAVWAYFEALTSKRYQCFVKDDTLMPMMHMDDCIRGTVDFLHVPQNKLKQRTYNLGAVSYTPAQLAASIRKTIPAFDMTYKPDERQAIADSWPVSLDDSAARRDWGWNHKFDLDAITKDMLDALRPRLTAKHP